VVWLLGIETKSAAIPNAISASSAQNSARGHEERSLLVA
jgi:hypothetical protein